jgi:putative SOS response-associated peptidase YedK
MITKDITPEEGIKRLELHFGSCEGMLTHPLTMLSTAGQPVDVAFYIQAKPGPDIAPYHDGQSVILERKACADWLDPSLSAKLLIKPLLAGSLLVEQVG